jgi:hypothetical protein
MGTGCEEVLFFVFPAQGSCVSLKGIVAEMTFVLFNTGVFFMRIQRIIVVNISIIVSSIIIFLNGLLIIRQD